MNVCRLGVAVVFEDILRSCRSGAPRGSQPSSIPRSSVGPSSVRLAYRQRGPG